MSSSRAANGLNIPLLADVDGAVAKSFGAHAPVVGTRRAVVIVDEEGIVRHRHDHRLGLDFQDVGDVARRRWRASSPAPGQQRPLPMHAAGGCVGDASVVPRQETSSKRFARRPGSACGAAPLRARSCGDT